MEKTKRVSESGKLDHVAASVWTVKRDKNGKSIEDRVYEQLVDNEVSNKKIGSRFWTNIFADFNLSVSLELPYPSKDATDAPSADLWDASTAAHNESSACVRHPFDYDTRDHRWLWREDYIWPLESASPKPLLTVNLAASLQASMLMMWDRNAILNECATIKV